MIFAFDDFELDAPRLELRRGGKLVKADALVLRLLSVLVRDAGELVTKETLVTEVWEGRSVADNVITVSMARLRKTLHHRRGEREFIATAYGRGYRFVRAVETRTTNELGIPRSPSPRDTAPAFVGRERVLGGLRQGLSLACAGRGRLCALIGEPGIGKTYVVEALERDLSRTTVRVAWGFCREAGDTPPLWPWLRLVREVTSTARALEWDMLRDPVVEELDRMLRSLDTGVNMPAMLRNMGLDAGKRHQLLDAIARFFSLAARHMPWLLVLEDLHRADAASLELLSHLLDEISHMRVLIVATLRPAETRRAARALGRLPQVLGHRNCERVVLERLRENDVAAYLGHMLGDLDGVLGKAVYVKSEGNPFFMAELTRQLLATGHTDVDDVTLPDVSLDLVRQHVARLEPETRSVLAAAAVIGRTFELPLLRAITEREPSALMALVDEAIAAEVVIAAPDSMTGFAFGHELLRTVLYDALTPADRRRWHLRVAEALEARLGTGDAAPPSELAYHFHSALPEGDLKKTVRFCREAAVAAALAFANVDVIRYVHHALEALEMLERPSVRLRMHLLFVASMYARGTSAVEFARATRALVQLASEQRDGLMLGRGAVMLNLHPGLKPMPGAVPALERSLALLPPDNQAMRASVLASLASSAPYAFDERSYALIAEAVPLARASSSRAGRYVCLLVDLYLHGGPAHEERGSEIAKELEQLGQQHIHRMPVLPVDLAFYRAITALQQGDIERMRAAIDRATARARELQHTELLWHCARFRSMAKINAGDYADGVAQLDVLHRQAEQRGFFGTGPFCAFDRAVVMGEADRPVELDEPLRKELAYDASEPPSIWSMKVRALAALGLLDEGRAALRAIGSASDLRRLPCDTHFLGTIAHVGRAALKLNDLAYAEVAYQLLLPYAERHYAGHVSFLCEGSVAHVLGALAHGLGRPLAAIAHLERGVVMDERAGLAPRAAECRDLLARCLLERGGADDRERAFALEREVAVSARKLGLRQLAREAGVLLAGQDSSAAASTHAH
ncbi:MAG: AAA family ATPase [Polyangiales bacterium]